MKTMMKYVGAALRGEPRDKQRHQSRCADEIAAQGCVLSSTWFEAAPQRSRALFPGYCQGRPHESPDEDGNSKFSAGSVWQSQSLTC